MRDRSGAIVARAEASLRDARLGSFADWQPGLVYREYYELPPVDVDRDGRVTWLKEGYAAGDEAEWSRQLERAAGNQPPPPTSQKKERLP